MPTTIDYNIRLKAQLAISSQNKRVALQNQFDRATAAIFDSGTGALSFRKDASGNPLYGTLDVDFQEQQRGINTQSEGAGMLRSGQRARTLATSEAGYRATVGGLAESLAAGKTSIDDDEALQIAEYDALYGQIKASSGGGGSTPYSGSTPSSGLPPVPAVPAFQPYNPPGQTRTPDGNNVPKPKRGPLQGPVQGPPTRVNTATPSREQSFNDSILAASKTPILNSTPLPKKPIRRR